MGKVTKVESGEISKATENFFAKYGRAATSRSIFGRLLKFSKFGEYRAGQYDDEVAKGTRLAAYMNSFCIGYMRWEASRPVETIMGPVGEGFIPPKREDLGYLDQSQWEKFDDGRLKDPWSFCNSIVLYDQREAGDGYYTFTTSSQGGIKALGLLSYEYGNRLRQKPDEFPVVALGVGSYQHPNRAYGEIRYPVFEVVDWVPVNRLPPLEGATPAAQVADGSTKSANF